MKTKNTILSALVASALLTGCGTLSLETNVKMTKSVWLKPISKEKSTVFISLKNISGEDLNILEPIKAKLAKKHYTIVDKADGANYVVMINILFANNLKEASDIKSAGVLGLGAGAISSSGGHSSGDSILIGAGIALASGLVGSALADETYRAVVDIVINEQSNDPRHNNSIDSVESSYSIMGAGYKEHKTRVLAEAVKTNLKLDEALPILSNDISTQISNIF